MARGAWLASSTIRANGENKCVMSAAYVCLCMCVLPCQTNIQLKGRRANAVRAFASSSLYHSVSFTRSLVVSSKRFQAHRCKRFRTQHTNTLQHDDSIHVHVSRQYYIVLFVCCGRHTVCDCVALAPSQLFKYHPSDVYIWFVVRRQETHVRFSASTRSDPLAPVLSRENQFR